jgi:hypothetical protein
VNTKLENAEWFFRNGTAPTVNVDAAGELPVSLNPGVVSDRYSVTDNNRNWTYNTSRGVFQADGAQGAGVYYRYLQQAQTPNIAESTATTPLRC